MSYFHTGIRTIIGAKAFHCPVRDGKEWYHLAMVIRHKGLPHSEPLCSEFIESTALSNLIVCHNDRHTNISLTGDALNQQASKL